jgi:CubicO group peptidase (beta-lactamase class C family)
MKKFFVGIVAIFTILLASNTKATAQLYFPPLGVSTAWDTMSPSELAWCPLQLDTLHNFLDTTNSKAFIVLKNGKVVLEWYFDSFTKDSTWYWASAGKSLTAFLCGVAQQAGALNISDKTSTYLGQGWTIETLQQEDSIKIVHQLSMTTGLRDFVLDQDCTIDTCLKYKATAGTRWAYHNAPYHLLQDVIKQATSAPSFQNYMNTTLSSRTGIQGLIANYVMYSKPRVMARFGLLMLNKGIWNNDTILKDQAYYNAMVSSSQTLNPSYGYLWWLNGKSSYMLPGTQTIYTGSLVPNAPADMYCAMGKNDQRIYVLPTDSLVVVRMGESAYGTNALSDFDNALWALMNRLKCNPTLVQDGNAGAKLLHIWPLPCTNTLYVQQPAGIAKLKIFDMYGRLVLSSAPATDSIELSTEHFLPGQYVLQIIDYKGFVSYRSIVKR